MGAEDQGRADSSVVQVVRSQTTQPRISVVMIEHIPATDQASEPPRQAQTQIIRERAKEGPAGASRRAPTTSGNFPGQWSSSANVHSGRCFCYSSRRLRRARYFLRRDHNIYTLSSRKRRPGGGMLIGWHAAGARILGPRSLTGRSQYLGVLALDT